MSKGMAIIYYGVVGMSGIDERNPAWQGLIYVLKDTRDALQQLVNER